jgi:hypothetical protein
MYGLKPVPFKPVPFKPVPFKPVPFKPVPFKPVPFGAAVFKPVAFRPVPFGPRLVQRLFSIVFPMRRWCVRRGGQWFTAPLQGGDSCVPPLARISSGAFLTTSLPG